MVRMVLELTFVTVSCLNVTILFGISSVNASAPHSTNVETGFEINRV